MYLAMETTKLEHFYKPNNLDAYLAGKTLATIKGASRTELVEIIESLSPSEAILLEDQIIPYGPTPPSYRHSLNFLKRGREVILPVPSAARDCDDTTDPLRLRRLAVDRMDPAQNYCGFAWRPVRDHKRKRKVHLDDCLAAGKLFAFAEKSTGKNRITLREYDDVDAVSYMGATYVCEVPSRSSDKVYPFQVRSVPVPRSSGEYAVWTDIDTNRHDCEVSVKGRFTFRDRAHQVTFCPHEIAAYFAISKHRYGKDGKLMLQPFPLFTQSMVDYWKHLHTNVLIQSPYEHPKTGKVHMRRRPLNMAEREALLQSKVALRKHEATLFAKRKIREYDWG